MDKGLYLLGSEQNRGLPLAFRAGWEVKKHTYQPSI